MSFLPIEGHAVEFSAVVDEDKSAVFAGLVDDHNPLYVSDDFAARTIYGARLVHGALLVGLVNSALTQLTGPGYVLMGQEVRFSAAVRISEEVHVTAEVIRVQPDKRIVSAETRIFRQDGESAFRGIGGLMQLDLEKLSSP